MEDKNSNLPPGVTDNNIPGNEPEGEFAAFYESVDSSIESNGLLPDDAHEVWRLGMQEYRNIKVKGRGTLEALQETLSADRFLKVIDGLLQLQEVFARNGGGSINIENLSKMNALKFIKTLAINDIVHVSIKE